MLIIAAIGIFNLLQMAVHERTREIGILGAFGLKQRQISLLFLLEGLVMSFFGMGAGFPSSHCTCQQNTGPGWNRLGGNFQK